jgi:galactose mutarotase-like enzyme
VELLAVYRHAQMFALKAKDDVALEPMSAPTSALTSGRGLQFVEPGEPFRIGVQAVP